MENTSTQHAMNKGSRIRRLILLTLAVAFCLAVGSLYATRYFETRSERSPPPERVGRNAPFITTSDAVVEKMVEMAELTKDDVVYDLGCGDGRIVITAALRSGCRGVGFDIDPERVAEARENVKRHGVEDLVEIREQDIFKVDLSESSAVLFYLLPWMNKKLIPQFQEMKAGTRILSHDFGLGDITDIPPDATETVEIDESEHYIHRWNIPLKIPK